MNYSVHFDTNTLVLLLKYILITLLLVYFVHCSKECLYFLHVVFWTALWKGTDRRDPARLTSKSHKSHLQETQAEWAPRVSSRVHGCTAKDQGYVAVWWRRCMTVTVLSLRWLHTSLAEPDVIICVHSFHSITSGLPLIGSEYTDYSLIGANQWLLPHYASAQQT